MFATSKGRQFPRGIRLKLDKDSNALFFFHLCAYLLFLSGLCWHLKTMWSSGTTEMLIFLQFFSSWSYLVQFTALLASNLTHLFPKVALLYLSADILSSAVFAICNVDCITHCLLRLLASPASPSFRQEGFWVSMLLPAAYVGWSVPLAVFFRKGYPYPFLNKMSQPEGFILVSLAALTAIYGFYEAGALLVGGNLQERGRSGSAIARKNKKK